MAENGETDLSNLLSHVMVRRTRQDIIDQHGEKDEDGRQYLQMGGERRYLPERHLHTVDYNLHETYSTAGGVNDSIYDAIVETLEELTDIMTIGAVYVAGPFSLISRQLVVHVTSRRSHRRQSSRLSRGA